MKNFYLLLILLLFTQGVVGQSICGSELDLSAIQQNDPARYQRKGIITIHFKNR